MYALRVNPRSPLPDRCFRHVTRVNNAHDEMEHSKRPHERATRSTYTHKPIDVQLTILACLQGTPISQRQVHILYAVRIERAFLVRRWSRARASRHRQPRCCHNACLGDIYDRRSLALRDHAPYARIDVKVNDTSSIHVEFMMRRGDSA